MGNGGRAQGTGTIQGKAYGGLTGVDTTKTTDVAQTRLKDGTIAARAKTSSGRTAIIDKNMATRMAESAKAEAKSKRGSAYFTIEHTKKGRLGVRVSEVSRITKSQLVKAYNIAHGTNHKNFAELAKTIKLTPTRMAQIKKERKTFSKAALDKRTKDNRNK
jgi:hypothetical protein